MALKRILGGVEGHNKRVLAPIVEVRAYIWMLMPSLPCDVLGWLRALGRARATFLRHLTSDPPPLFSFLNSLQRQRRQEAAENDQTVERLGTISYCFPFHKPLPLPFSSLSHTPDPQITTNTQQTRNPQQWR